MKKLSHEKRANGEMSSYKYYYNQIANIPMLSREEERALLIKAKQGDIEARNKIVMANQRFVIKIAKQYSNRGIPFEDLISEGNIGLIHAVEKFDLSKDCHFLTYAVWWIRQSILQAIAEQSRIVRLPLNQIGSLNKINKTSSKFEQENERMPSPEEIASLMDIPKEKIADTMRVSGRHVSIDAPFVEGEDNSLLDVLQNDDSPVADNGLILESLSNEIQRTLSTLADREREVVCRFFGLGCSEMTLEEIAEEFGLTRERVRQIKEKAIRRLRQSSRSKGLKAYLG